MASITTPTREIKSAAEMRAGYDAAHARLWGPPKVEPPKLKLVEPEPEPVIPAPVAPDFDLAAASLFDDDMLLPPRHLRARYIHTIVARHYSITFREIRGKRRLQKYAIPRHVAAYICVRHAGMSMPQVGSFTRRDHTTVLHSRDCIISRMERDQAFAGEVAALVTECGFSG